MGLRKSSVQSCKSSNNKGNTKVFFFKFPIEYSSERRRVVVNNCDPYWTPSPNSVICHLNFSHDDIIDGQRLRPGAFPVKTDVQVKTGKQ